MSGSIKEIQIGSKSAYVHQGKNTRVGFVIGHGASGDANSGLLPQIAEEIAQEGITVIRYNASGQLKSRISTLETLTAHDELKDIQKWILSGFSMGGRTACAVARKQGENVLGVVLFSYPLHPPGKKEELRDEDLTALICPVLIVKGTKDPFSTEPTFSDVMKRMSSKDLQIEQVENGDHGLSTKTKIGQERFDKFIGKVREFTSHLIQSEGAEPERKKPKKEQSKKEVDKFEGKVTKRKAAPKSQASKKTTPKKRAKKG